MIHTSATVIQKTYRNRLAIKKIKNHGIELASKIARDEITYTSPGSLTYLLFGVQPSKQSISIKFGHVGEKLIKSAISSHKYLKLLKCGLHCMVDGKKKDIDLLWIDPMNKIVYYREAKGNIEMDTEKIPAMISKIKECIEPYVNETYPDYTINIGVIAWGVYKRSSLQKGKSHIKKIEGNGIVVDHFSDLLKLIDLKWDEEDFYNYWKQLGNIVSNNNH